MPCVTLSADEIKAAPPEVRHWLEQLALRVFDHGTRPDHPSPARLQMEEPRQRGAIAQSVTVETGSAKERNEGVNKLEVAVGNAAIQKLIAERAYELWENQGKPHGCDLIHWHEAEQEITDCVRRSSLVPPGNAAIQKLIAERAYALWENQGKPHGCDLIHWHEGEQEIMDCVRQSLLAPQYAQSA